MSNYFEMACLNEYNNAVEMLTEIFRSTRDNPVLPFYVLYSLKNRFKEHLDRMIAFTSPGSCFYTEDFGFYIPAGQSSAKEEYDYALQTLNDLFELVRDGVYVIEDVKLLRAKTISRMRNMVYVHCRMHEERYNQDIRTAFQI